MLVVEVAIGVHAVGFGRVLRTEVGPGVHVLTVGVGALGAGRDVGVAVANRLLLLTAVLGGAGQTDRRTDRWAGHQRHAGHGHVDRGAPRRTAGHWVGWTFEVDAMEYL